MHGGSNYKSTKSLQNTMSWWRKLGIGGNQGKTYLQNINTTTIFMRNKGRDAATSLSSIYLVKKIKEAMH